MYVYSPNKRYSNITDDNRTAEFGAELDKEIGRNLAQYDNQQNMLAVYCMGGNKQERRKECVVRK